MMGLPENVRAETVASRPHRWCVRRIGKGPDTLMLHGAGSAGPSFGRLATLLAGERHLIIPDLPGHGATRLGTRQRSGLPHMAEDVEALVQTLGADLDLIIAHSAGAAVALQMATGGQNAPIVAINPALKSFDGVAGWLFPLLAKAMAANPLAPQLLARLTGREARIRELLEGQGSAVDDDMARFYRSLASDPRHIAGTLAMMGQWSVEPLRRALPDIRNPVLFLAGDKDKTVSPDVSVEAAAMMPTATLRRLPGLGHLAHEEAPDQIADQIRAFTKVSAA